MAEYGKDLIRDEKEFNSWVKKTTAKILNEGCEDKREITEMLAGTKPKTFPAMAVWVYHPRIHQIFIEWVCPTDFTPATETPALPPEGGLTKQKDVVSPPTAGAEDHPPLTFPTVPGCIFCAGTGYHPNGTAFAEYCRCQAGRELANRPDADPRRQAKNAVLPPEGGSTK